MLVPDMDLDEIDRAILNSLLSDARASQRQLSRDVGVAQGTITNEFVVWKSGHHQGSSVVIDPESVGWNMTIMAGLRIAKGRMIDVQQKIAATQVFSVYDVTGDYDSMVLARVKNAQI